MERQCVSTPQTRRTAFAPPTAAALRCPGGGVRKGLTEDGSCGVVISFTGEVPEEGPLSRAEAAVQRLVDIVLCEGDR